MQSFQTTSGGQTLTWDLELNIAAVKRLRGRLGLDLLAAEDLQRVCRDPVALVDVLFVLVEPQATARKIDDEAFGAALGESFEPASRAFLEELAVFFDRVGRRLLAKLARETLAQAAAVDAAIDARSEQVAAAVAKLRESSERQLDEALAALIGEPNASTSGNASPS